jgi:hypothetical protein
VARPRRLDVDPGPPPAADAQLGATEDELNEPQPPDTAGVVLAQLEEWETETVELFVGFFLLVLHWTIGRAGPPDAFVPDDYEKRQMARPLTRALNRSERARRIAARGDMGAFLLSFGGFVVKEAESVAAYRSAAAGGPQQAPDADLPDAYVHEAGAEHVQGAHRRWRPPAVPPDEPT